MPSENFPTDFDNNFEPENNRNNNDSKIDIEALAKEIFKLIKSNLRIENERIARK